ncbi:MAG TPA: stage II sporulation protein R, partial [Bacillota bacterium]
MGRRGLGRRLATAAACLSAASLLLAARPWLGEAPAAAHTEPVAPPVVRLHVVAHSDEPFDQDLKLLVRDRLLAYLHDSRLLDGAATPEQALAAVAGHARRLEELARGVLRAHGVGYDVAVEVGHHRYDQRTYRGLTLPAGVYPSMRVLLGAARGANWWCVLYPIMCTVEPILEPGVVGAGEPDPAASDPAVAAALYRQPALDEALLWPE